MNIKTKTVEAKADANGSISGYASTWTREPDAYGDVVAKGAFAESIAAIIRAYPVQLGAGNEKRPAAESGC